MLESGIGPCRGAWRDELGSNRARAFLDVRARARPEGPAILIAARAVQSQAGAEGDGVVAAEEAFAGLKKHCGALLHVVKPGVCLEGLAARG